LVCSSALAALQVQPGLKVAKPSIQRTLSFDERVDAQAAIERVYYSHQIGATKPFEEAVPRSVIENKVRNYMEQTVALQTYWKTAVTDEALQRELERMAQGTRMPERLQEVYAALGNDTFLVKECVARATLVERLTHNFYAFDPRYQAAPRARIDLLRGQIQSGALSPNADHPNRTVSERPVSPETEVTPGPSIDSSTPAAKLEDKSLKRSVPGQPSAIVESRDGFAFDFVLSESPTTANIATYVVPKITWSVWWSSVHAALRSESVIAVASDRVRLPQPTKGSTFDPNAACTGDGWNDGILDDLPEPRAQHSAIWTGSLMLVWGGTNFGGFATLETGGRYDPVTDTWQSMTTVNAPRPRIGNSTVWTGSEMIVWGGYEYFQSNLWLVSGGRYDPIADRWTRMSLGPSARRFHTAVWTGTRMIVWGGYFSLGSQYAPDILNTGSLYDPSTDSWTPTATAGAPPGRYQHSAIWTGSEMIVWGGYASSWFAGGELSGAGGRYNPSTNSWVPMTGTTPRANHSAIWTGSLMVVWGGSSFVPCPDCNPNPLSVLPVNTGSRYDPVQDRWTVMSTEGAPDPENSPFSFNLPWPVTWTGHDMIVLRNNGGPNAGWRYDPSTNHWTSIASDGSSLAPIGASLVWTGKVAITWGGLVPSDFFRPVYLNTGRRYDPWTDSWTPTSTSSPASQRSGHSAVWTGNEMIVWGGAAVSTSTYLNSGGRYDPATDSWTATSTESAPVPRAGHTALWGSDVMLVWGGGGSAGAPNSGGRYDPRTDTWSPISQANAPGPRLDHAAVWTGRRMIVWGGRDATLLPSGALYDPSTDHWTAMSTVNAPSGRYQHTAVWTGARAVFWGGFSGPPFVETNTGGLYDPETDTWTLTSTDGAPSARAHHTAVWAGDRMVVWGGESLSSSGVQTGGRYDPVHDVWSPTTTDGAPPPTTLHSAVAAGSSMLIWGGSSSYVYVPNTGGIYDVPNDRWTKIAKPGVVLALVTSVWTGDAMIVWSGISGGRYYPGHSRDADCDQDGVTAAAGDCDDHDPATYPGASESCDGVANDCGRFGWPSSNEYDEDRDGWLNCGGDCNDRNIYQHPGAVEACDGWDTDCDGQDPTPTEADNDHDGYRICQGDCDDTRYWVRPGYREDCDGLDNDCNGAIDEGGDALCVFNHGCTAGKCSGSEGCTEIEDLDIACDDKSPCTVDDRCRDGDCYGTPKANGTPCDDGRFCTVNEACYFGQCYEGQNRDCGRDGNDCNGREYCDYLKDACTTLDVLGCDDGNICTADGCDPATGCNHTNNVDPCDDGNACTVGDTCGDSLCLPGVARDCDDDNPCTVDSCDPQSGCVHNPEPEFTYCDDYNACTGADYCDGYGTCISPYPPQCDDHVVCTEDYCDPATGCAYRMYPTGTSCSDGDACNGVETCDGVGACVGSSPVVCGALDQCHTPGICNPATGSCSNPIAPNGTACNDSSLCTSGETCQSGTCTAAFSALSEPNPRSNGYYMRLCLGPHSGDLFTDADAACVGQVATTFAGMTTVADLCAVLRPQDPNNDPCDRTSADLMVLALNICRARVCSAQSIDSQCGGNDNVGQSLAESDGILLSPSRNADTCAHAKCLDEEINTGRALELNSLELRREASDIRLNWNPPYLDDGTGHPRSYHVWRRLRGSLAPFAKIGTTTNPTYLDAASGSGAVEYEVTAVMN
jgi:N-acetylneuraminic acid mutarotase